jgi:outer membrane murein-binding lipoprotein Lpp
MSPDEFNKEFGPEFTGSPIDLHPYGPPAQPVKTGLTKRGKAALAVSAAVIGGSTLIGYQMYSADAAENEAKAQEIAYKQDQLELEKLKAMKEVNAAGTITGAERQERIDACVKDSRDLIGKTIGTSLRDIVDACQAQYTDTTTTAAGADLQAAASTSSTGTGGVNNGLLIGISVLGLVAVLAARKGSRTEPA